MTNDWIDTRNCEPLEDGMYFVQTVTGDMRVMNYTFEGGWNTHRNEDGTVCEHDEHFNDGFYVARWYKVPKPDTIPHEWLAEWRDTI